MEALLGGKEEKIGRNNICPPQTAKVLYKSIIFLKENMAWSKEGKVAVHYQLCLFKVTLTWGIEFRPTKSSRGLGICFPGRLISKKRRGETSSQCKSFVTPEFPDLSFRAWLRARHQSPYHKTPKLTDKTITTTTTFGCKSRTAKQEIIEHLLSVCCGHPCWMPSPNLFPAASLLIGSCSCSSNHSFPTHTV